MAEEVQTRIVVRVQPNAGQNRLTRFEDGMLYIKIAAPPVKGRANLELVKFLSDILDVPKGNIIIEKGMNVRKKVVAIKRITQHQAMEQLKKLDKQQ